MDDLAQTDRETREWLRDLDNFGMPPPQRHLNKSEEVIINGYENGNGHKKTSSAPPERREIPSADTHSLSSRTNGVANNKTNNNTEFVPGDANDPVFLEKVRKFQLINSHPYANKSRVEVTKKIGVEGNASAAVLAANNNHNSHNKNYFIEQEKQKITKEEVEQMTGEVRRTNRPVNPYAEPKTPSPAPTSRPSSAAHQGATTNGAGHHHHNHLGVTYGDNGSSSAYSSYSSVGDTTTPAVFSASRAVPSPHEKSPPVDISAIHSAQSASATKRRFSGFAAAAPKYHSNGFDSTRSTPARTDLLSPTNIPHAGAPRSASHAPESAVFSVNTRRSLPSTDRELRNANTNGNGGSNQRPVIDGVFHATPLRIVESEEPAVDLEDAYNRFERTLSSTFDDERSRVDASRRAPPTKEGVVDRVPLGTKLSTSYTNTFTTSPHRSSVNEAISPVGRKDAPSSSSSDLTNRSPTISTGSSTGGGGRVPPWRLANQMKPRSNSSLEALETQQRMFERLQDEVEQELASKKQAVYGTCRQCHQPVTDAADATQALGHLFHSRCFTCHSCGRALRGKRFYEVNDKTYCEEDYLYSGFQQSAERCAVCNHLIMDMVLQAVGKSFHPQCFKCHSCKECLDGIPFALDGAGHVYCINDYHRLFAPKCAACQKPILPATETGETVRVVAINQDYHIECYVCEGCGLQLTDEPTKRCFPLGNHLLCHQCHVHWLRTGGADKPITDL